MRVQLARRRSAQEGAVAVLVTILAVVLFAMAAFVVDHGMVYANQRQVQTAADAAALAGAREILRQSPGTDDCDTMLGNAGDADAVALSYLVRNEPATKGTSIDNDVTVTCEDEGARLDVHATTSYKRSTFLGGLFGVDEFVVTGEARAAVGPANSVVGVVPFGVCEVVAKAILEKPDELHTINFGPDEGCGKSDGNRMVFDLDDSGEGDSVNSGASSVNDWVKFGYDKPVTIPDSGSVTFGAKPGELSGYHKEFNARLERGSNAVIPVFERVEGGGRDTTYTLTGYMGIEICGFGKHGPSCPGAPPATAKSYLNVRSSAFIPVGELSEWCGLGAECDTGLRVVKLVD